MIDMTHGMQHPSQSFCSASPDECGYIEYSASHLLRARLPACLVSHKRFDEGCTEGYAAYSLFVERQADGTPCRYSFFEVVEYVMDNFTAEVVGYVDVTYRCGYLLGWLSAVALTDKVVAMRGLDLMMSLVAHGAGLC